MGRADQAGAGSYALPQRQASFRFRDDTTSLLRRARRAVAEWHREQPRGSAEELVAAARKFVGRVLDRGHPCGEPAVQLVSELVTNSVQHSDSADPEGVIGVTVSGTLTSVTVEVADAGGAQAPQVRPAEDLDAEGGRGLQMVAALASEWGIRENAAGRVTWFTSSDAAGRTGRTGPA